MSVVCLLFVLGLEVYRVSHRLDDELFGAELSDVDEDSVALVVHLHLGQAVVGRGGAASRGGAEHVAVEQRVVGLDGLQYKKQCSVFARGLQFLNIIFKFKNMVFLIWENSLAKE